MIPKRGYEEEAVVTTSCLYMFLYNTECDLVLSNAFRKHSILIDSISWVGLSLTRVVVFKAFCLLLFFFNE